MSTARVLSDLTLKLSSLTFGAVAITRGSITLELTIAVGMLSTRRIMGMYTVACLHIAIFFVSGLFSFPTVWSRYLHTLPFRRTPLRNNGSGPEVIRPNWGPERRSASWGSR